MQHLVEGVVTEKWEIAIATAKLLNNPCSMFNEEKDYLDVYLSHFEMYAEAQNWHWEHWTINLSALLTGK